MQVYHYLKRSLRKPQVVPLLNGATLLFGLLLLVVIGWRNRHTLDQPWLFDYRMLGLSLLFYSLNLAVVVYGWGQLVNQLGGQPLAYRQHLRVYAATNLSRRLPGSFWYIAGRAVQYNQLAIPTKITSLASILEYIFLAISSIAASLLLAPFMFTSLSSSLPLLIAGITVGLIIIHPRIIRRILKLLRQPTDVPLTYWRLFRSLSWYVLGWFLGGGILYGIVRFLQPLPWSAFPSIIGFWCLSGLISWITFFSPSGLGFKEISLSMFLASQVPPPTAIAVAISSRFILILFEFLWTIIVFRLE